MSGDAAKRRLVIVTGMSGAGRTTCLKILEDQGFEAVDNLPIGLVERLVQPAEGLERDLAVGIDSRTRAFDPSRLAAFVEQLARAGERIDVRLVFFDCDDEVLRRRFTETRRRHPLAGDRPVLDGIAAERELMAPLRAAASLLVDTSQLDLPGLRRLLAGQFGTRESARGLTITCTSFAYRLGLPREADLVFDVRFLRNPHYDPALQPLTGLDPEVTAYIAADSAHAAFFSSLVGLIRPLLPRYSDEGKSYLTIAIGCTGGRHRSVFVAEALARALRADGYEVSTVHRELVTRAASARLAELPVATVDGEE